MLQNQVISCYLTITLWFQIWCPVGTIMKQIPVLCVISSILYKIQNGVVVIVDLSLIKRLFLKNVIQVSYSGLSCITPGPFESPPNIKECDSIVYHFKRRIQNALLSYLHQLWLKIYEVKIIRNKSLR